MLSFQPIEHSLAHSRYTLKGNSFADVKIQCVLSLGSTICRDKDQIKELDKWPGNPGHRVRSGQSSEFHITCCVFLLWAYSCGTQFCTWNFILMSKIAWHMLGLQYGFDK